MPHNFGPASIDETIVYGASRPGYSSPSVQSDEVQDWIQFMKENGIQRVCCLLEEEQLAYYPCGLLQAYRDAFGEEQVCHAPVRDYRLCSLALLEQIVLPFLAESVRLEQKVVVHCSGGVGRSGHVLVAWLVYGRKQGIDEAVRAVQTVPGVSRNPREAVGIYSTAADFEQLFNEIVGLP
jgi:protein-tyrosine phosphatase